MRYPIYIKKDCSVFNYYMEAFCFNNWLNDSTNKINKDDLLKNRKQDIIDNISNNLKLSIANYSAYSSNNYKLPELTEEDWEQALSNISMITFFQGVKTGLKTYNNYAIVTSETNNEYVNNNSLYLIVEDGIYYHRYGCGPEHPYDSDMVYKNTDFKPQPYYTKNNELKYYYKHEKQVSGTMYAYQPCYLCIINRNRPLVSSEWYEDYYKVKFRNALARERYVQMEKTKLFK